MTRLRRLTRTDLDASQQRVWDAVTKGRRGTEAELTDEAGGLIGPLNALLYSPTVGEKIADLGEAVRFDVTLDRRLSELAILTVAAHWRADFDFWMHRDPALRAGLEPEVVDAIGRGDEPRLVDEQAATTYRVVRQLLDAGRLDDATYAAAVAAGGERWLVEVIALVAYYCFMCFTLNVFEVAVPPGVVLPWNE